MAQRALYSLQAAERQQADRGSRARHDWQRRANHGALQESPAAHEGRPDRVSKDPL